MAPKVSKTPREGGNEPEIVPMMEFLGQKPVGEPKPTQTAAQPSVADLIAQIGALGESQRRLERINEGLMMQPGPAAAAANGYQAPSATPNIDLKGLPDPITEPEAYHEALATRIGQAVDGRVNATLQTREAQQRQSTEGERRHSALWGEFVDQHPTYAEHDERVEFAASKVLARMRDKGLDVNRYMTQATDLFFGEVKKEYDKTFGEPEVGETPAEAASQPRVRTKEAPVDETDPGRTGGIFGGTESGGAPTRQTADKPGDMIKDLTDLQRASGLF